MSALDVIVFRGAPGSGKTSASKCLAARLDCGARVEVDALRSMIVNVDWANQADHIGVLALTIEVVAHFLSLGHGPVIVVDTFSGDKLLRFLMDLGGRLPDAAVGVFTLVPRPSVLRARVLGRPAREFRDLPICVKLNEEMVRHLHPCERIIDNSDLSPEETVDAILGERLLDVSSAR